EYEDELTTLRQERAELWQERAELWQERAELWQERAELWQERAEVWQKRAELAHQLALKEGEHQALADELAWIKNSRAWRLYNFYSRVKHGYILPIDRR